MNDYISRQEAIEYFMTNTNWHDEDGYPIEDADEKRKLLKDYFSGVPSADVRQNVKGKWIPVDSYTAFGGDEDMWNAHGNPTAFYYCSECKNHAYLDDFGEAILSNFCSDCGADMRGDSDEAD